MKKGNGLKRTVVGLLATVMATTPLTGCGTPKDDRTITMDVAASVTAEVGSEYTIPTVFAFDGTTDYEATATVKNGNDEISLTNNKFVVKLMSDYTITYYADCGNGKDITKTTTLKVKDETDPIITVGTVAKGKVGEKYALDYAVSDNSGIVNVEFTVKFEDGSDVTVSDGGFTPDKVGNYIVTIKATDSKDNATTETVTVTVGETFTTTIAEDLELEFFADMPGTAEYVTGVAGETEGLKEGSRTLKVSLAANSQMWTSYKINRSLAGTLLKVYDAISFDVIAPNAQYMHTIGNGADWNDSSVLVKPDEWTTVTLSKSAVLDFNTTDPASGQPRIIGNGTTDEGGYGSEDLSIYFDNVRGVMNSETVIMGNTLNLSERYADITGSFEDSAIVDFNVVDEGGNAVTSGVDGEAYTFTPSAKGNYTVYATLRKTNYRDLKLAIAVTAELGNMMPESGDLEASTVKYLSNGVYEVIEGTAGTTTGIREGNKAVKIAIPDGDEWPTYVLDPATVNQLVTIYDAVAVDVYTEGEKTHKIGAGDGWANGDVLIPARTWTTVTYSKDVILNHNRDGVKNQQRYIHNGLAEEPENNRNENFTIYFDNLRGVINTDNVIVGETKDFSEKINSIKSTLGADSATLVVKKNGTAVSGVSGFVFSATEAGKYTAEATFTKANYNDYTVSIDFEVEVGDMMPATTDLETKTVNYGSAPIEIIEGTAGTTTGIREGSKAVKFVVTTANQWPTYTLNPDVVKKLVTIYDAVKVDVYTEAANSHQIGNGKDWNDSMVTIDPRTWTTVTYTKDAIANYNGTGQSRAIYNDSGNENITFYFDNLRGVIYTDNVIVGETKDFSEKINSIKSTLGADSATLVVKKNGTAVGGVSGFVFSAAEAGKYIAEATFTKANYNDYTVSIDFEVTKATMYPSGESKDGESITDVFKQSDHQAKLSVNYDKAFVREGDTSIKWAIESTDYGYCSYTLNTESDYVKNLLANYDAISFDVYVNGNKAKQVAVGTSWADKCITVQPKVWTTVTITKADLLAYTENRLLNNGDSYNEICDVYFDNLRGVKYYNDEVDAGSAVDYSERLNALKTSLGADSVSLTVAKDGVAVTEGVSGLTFTPAEGGNYTVKATFVKASYNDYVVSYDLSVIAADADKECGDGVFKQYDEQAKISINTDRAFVKEGRKSIKWAIESTDYGYCSYILDSNNDYVKELLETYNAVSFDVYVDGNKSKSLSVGSDWNTTCVEVQPKVWTTVTITKENLLANGGSRLLNNGGDRNEICDVYFDNLRGVNV